MTTVLLTAFSFMLIILIGAYLHMGGILPENAGDVVKRILINVTLPCAIIVNFSKIEVVGAEMLALTVLGIAANVIMIAVGIVITKKKSREAKALHILCLPAYNIGAFCLPFVQSFLPAMGSVAACMFDVGNSVMCTGATYAFASEYLSDNRDGFDVGSFAKRLLPSMPLLTYVLMFILSVARFRLPKPVLTLIAPMAAANTFTAMLMIGLLLRFEFQRNYIGDICRILGVRHVAAIVTALAGYYLLPFDIVIRRTLVLISFAPISAVAPAYTGMCGGDEGKASAANSISILLSVIELTFLLIIMKLY